ncbi:MAG: hypothetical protein IJ642_02770 [Oscillospiraceae bacterium]|nr:hypothetical protein [Oscillospiraceae bacterium]
MQEENVVLEIPELNEDSPEWVPPVLKKEEVPEKKQSCADVFFMQYVVCMIVLTVLFSVRLWDEQSFQEAVSQFSVQIHADSESWLIALIGQVEQLWN